MAATSTAVCVRARSEAATCARSARTTATKPTTMFASADMSGPSRIASASQRLAQRMAPPTLPHGSTSKWWWSSINPTLSMAGSERAAAGKKRTIMDIEIKPPVLIRAYIYGFLLLWIVVCVFACIKALPHTTALAPVGMLIAGGVFCWRTASVRATTEGTTLLVRNLYRTRRIPAADITDVRTGSTPMQPFGRTVFVVTRNDAVALDVGLFGRLRKGSERDRAALEAWLSEVRGPAQR